MLKGHVTIYQKNVFLGIAHAVCLQPEWACRLVQEGEPA